jgi:hypothetical protein
MAGLICAHTPPFIHQQDILASLVLVDAVLLSLMQGRVAGEEKGLSKVSRFRPLGGGLAESGVQDHGVVQEQLHLCGVSSVSSIRVVLKESARQLGR